MLAGLTMEGIRPTLQEFTALAKQATVVPVCGESLGDALTPVLACATLASGDGGYLLESVVGGEKWARYSFVGFEPDLIVRAAGNRYEELRPGRGGEVREVADPWDALRETLAGYRPAKVDWLPRFWGGAVGYVSYDAVRRFEPAVGDAKPAGPDDYDFAFAVGGTLLIFDNLRKTIRIVVLARTGQGEAPERVYADALARIARARERLADPLRLDDLPVPRESAEALELPSSSFDRAGFCKAVERAKEHIRAGDVFQLVLSQRFRMSADGVDSFNVYRVMRAINPSPYMYFVRFPHMRIAGASPETHVRVEDGVAELRPIAGTHRRSSDAAEDQRIEQRMLADPKEIAEHVMLVDLGRNDLGRISVPGSVRVTERMNVERYSHVMHIVSNVVGTLQPGRDAIDVLKATFPAGTLSGAPKVRAMQLIEEMEPDRRGIYGGAVGYIGFDGNMDVAIAIRTVAESGGQFTVQAGGGIVEASQPDSEYDETVNKASAALLSIARAARARSPEGA